MSYESLVKTAKKLIDLKGRELIVRNVTQVISNPSKPYEPSRATVSTTLRGVGTPTDLTYLKNSLIKATDTQYYIAGSDIASISIEDTISDDGKTRKVVAVEPIRPGDVTLLFIVHAR